MAKSHPLACRGASARCARWGLTCGRRLWILGFLLWVLLETTLGSPSDIDAKIPTECSIHIFLKKKKNRFPSLWAAAAGIGLSVVTGKCLSVPVLNSIHNRLLTLEYLLGSIPLYRILDMQREGGLSCLDFSKCQTHSIYCISSLGCLRMETKVSFHFVFEVRALSPSGSTFGISLSYWTCSSVSLILRAFEQSAEQ